MPCFRARACLTLQIFLFPFLICTLRVDGFVMKVKLSNQTRAQLYGTSAGLTLVKYPKTETKSAVPGQEKIHRISVWPFRPRHRYHSNRHAKPIVDELQSFFRSARIEAWIAFFLLCPLLLCLSVFIQRLELAGLRQNLVATACWLLAAAVGSGFMLAVFGSGAAATWIDGYFMEVTMSLDNLFVYVLIVSSFRAPRKQVRWALFVVSLFQMLYQTFLLMGIAGFLQQLEFLPVLVGVWLLYIGLEILRLSKHENFDANTSTSYQTLRFCIGNRLLPEYSLDGSILVVRDGRIRVTMLGPLTFCLVLCMFVLELDIVLAKLEEIPSHFVCLSSSVLATFALPELFFIAEDCFDRFRFLQTGIAILMLFFGMKLLLPNTFQVSDFAELIIMLCIILGFVLLSVVFGDAKHTSKQPEEKTGAKGSLEQKAVAR